MANDVFISYAYEDKPIADAICAKIESAKIRCWIAPRDITPGEHYASALVRAIDESAVFVVIFSHFADKSPHVKREIERAFNREKVIIPFRIDNIDPSDDIQYYIGNVHWLDALTPPLEEHINDLVTIIKKNIYKESEKEPFQLVISKSIDENPDTSKTKRGKFFPFNRICSFSIDLGVGIFSGFFTLFLFIGITNNHIRVSGGGFTPIGLFSMNMSFLIGIILCFIIFDITNKRRSLGKYIFKLRIFPESSNKISNNWRYYRATIKIVPFLIGMLYNIGYYATTDSYANLIFINSFVIIITLYLIWGVPIAFTEKSQALHDLIAGTVVYQEKNNGIQ